MRKLHLAVALLACSPLFAQTVGSLRSAMGTTTIGATLPETFIDVSHPATVAGSVTTATVEWRGGTNPSCTNGMKIRVVRPQSNGTLTIVAERGPFATQDGLVTVSLTPAIAVQRGDFLAVTQLQPLAPCGGALLAGSESTSLVALLDKDIVNGDPIPLNGYIGYSLQARATAAILNRVATIPAAGAAQGVGAFFRTAVQIANPTAHPIAGYFYYWPASGAGAVVALPYTLQASETKSYPDIVTSLSQTGLGSIDVMATDGQGPVVTTRVFSDNGAAGTLGFTEDVFTDAQAMHEGGSGYLTLPADLANFRMNIGVRTLDKAVTISIGYYGPTGSLLGVLPAKTYPANYFEQVPLSSFLGSTLTPLANGQINVYVSSGDVIVYGSTTDNRTTDSAIKFANR